MLTDLRKSIIDKILVGTIAIVVSTFVLHGYNLHLKAFESAQIRLNSLSSVAITNRDQILKSVADLRMLVYNRLHLSAAAQPAEPKRIIAGYLGSIRASAALLKPRFKEAATEADGIERKLYDGIYNHTNGSILGLTGDQIKDLDSQVVEGEVSFLNAFDKELAGVLSSEYDNAYSSFFVGSWYLQPVTLAGALILFSGVILLVLRPSSVDEE